MSALRLDHGSTCAALQHVIMQVPGRAAVPSSTQKSNIESSVVEFRAFQPLS